MYTHVHSAVGVAIVGSTYLVTKDVWLTSIIGGTLAFISHHYLDKLGKASLTRRELLFSEFIVMYWLLRASIVTDLWWIPILGIFAGNFMDLIDKKLYLCFFKWNIVRFFLKLGFEKTADKIAFGTYLNATKHFKCHRMRPLKQLTVGQTVALSIAMYALSILIYALSILIYFTTLNN